MSLNPEETSNWARCRRTRLTQPAIALKNGSEGAEKQAKFSDILLIVIRHWGICRAAALRVVRSSFSAERRKLTA